MRRLIVPCLVFFLTVPPAAVAQTQADKPTSPLESITVIATRPSEAVIDHFIFSRAAEKASVRKPWGWGRVLRPL